MGEGQEGKLSQNRVSLYPGQGLRHSTSSYCTCSYFNSRFTSSYFPDTMFWARNTLPSKNPAGVWVDLGVVTPFTIQDVCSRKELNLVKDFASTELPFSRTQVLIQTCHAQIRFCQQRALWSVSNSGNMAEGITGSVLGCEGVCWSQEEMDKVVFSPKSQAYTRLYISP